MRRLLFSLAALLLALVQVPASAQAPRPRLTVPYTDFTLANGLHVILHRDTSVPTVAVNVWYHVGSGSEKPGRTGFAHLFEHLMFEGSKNVPEGAFDSWLEAAGGSNNGSTNVSGESSPCAWTGAVRQEKPRTIDANPMVRTADEGGTFSGL